MLTWLDRITVPVIPSVKTEVILRNNNGTFEADPHDYYLTTLDFSFVWSPSSFVLSFQSMEGVVPVQIRGSDRFFDSHGETKGIVYEVDAGAAVLVKLRNLQNFNYVLYSLEVIGTDLLITLGKGTDTKNFWSLAYSSFELGFETNFSPVLGTKFEYAVPEDYGMKTLNLDVELDPTSGPSGRDLQVVFSGTPVIVRVIEENGFYVATNIGTKSNGLTIDWKRRGYSTIFTVRKKGGTNYLEYSFVIEQRQDKILTQISWKKGTESNQIPVFSLPPGSLPRIEGLASLTPDGNMVCELDYEIINNNYIYNYVVYNLNFLSEVKGCTTTIPEAVSYLQRFQSVDQTTFIGYAITRLILSQELFGKFDTHYLLQKYYPCFLTRLKESVWKAFLPFFVDPQYGVENYYLLFR
jgi:hypothetical protein